MEQLWTSMEIKPVIGKGKVVNMRKIQVVTDYELYKYEELDSKGKEKAKQKYLDGQDEYEFTDMVEADTTLVFPNSKLKVQYSLSYCQGDGLSVYGKLAFEDIFNILKGNSYPTLVEGIEPFTEKEIKTLRFYASEEGTLNVDINRRYPFFRDWCYNFADDWIDTFEGGGLSSIKTDLIYRFEKTVKTIMQRYCKEWEKEGYQFFYEIDDESMEEISEANGWEYLADGTLYVA